MKKILAGSFVAALLVMAVNLSSLQLSQQRSMLANSLLTAKPAEEILPENDFIKSIISENYNTHFELTNSQYLNVKLDSSENIKASLESVPNMVIIRLNANSGAASSVLTLGGFLPLTEYHKYEDDYTNHEAFTTDESGNYAYTQDISKSHLIFIQPRPSTILISDNSTGGDCVLKNIGVWDTTTKTCTLTKNINEAVQIQNNGITLDGAGYSNVGGTPITGFGIYINLKNGITIKNLTIRNFSYGIYTNAIVDTNFINNVIELNSAGGISVNSISGTSSNVRISGNTIASSLYGINLINGSKNNFIINNIIKSHSNTGIFIFGFNNTITGNTIENNRPYGVYLYREGSEPPNNKFYNNNFIINSPYQVYNKPEGGNIFNLDKPIGGNYWSGWISPDANKDRFVDNPYTIFAGGIDNLPWVAKDAWLDSIAPTTTINLSGTAGENGWYTSAVQVSLQAEDNVGGVGVEKIEYGWNGLDWNTYSAPFAISDEGIKKIYYRATDKAKNVELTQIKEISIDTIAPQTDADFSGSMGTNSWYISDVSTVITSIDNSSGSGVDKIEYSFNNSLWNIYSSVFTISEEGEKTVYYRAKDKAGNIGTVKNQTIKIDKTLPVISGQPDRPANQNNWYNQNVTVNFTCIDNISGPINPTINIAITSEGAGQQASGQCVDKAGNNSSLVIDGINIDKTNPEVSVVRSPEPNAQGWNNTAVIATFVATDSLSNIDGSSTSIINFNLEGADQGGNRVFKDKAGNEATAFISGVNIDLTAPVVEGSTATLPNINGWYNTDVTVHFNGNDSLSGIKSVSPDATMTNEGENQEITGTAEDIAGNSSSFKVGNINIDKTAPIITGAPLTLANSNNWYNANVKVHFTASDNLSGIESVTPTATISQEGVNQETSGTATDKAGNSASVEVKGINIDKTNPEVSVVRNPEANAQGWNNTAVIATFVATDSLSNIDGSSTDIVNFNLEGANQGGNRVFKDKAGNEATGSVSGVNIDLTTPVISGAVSPLANANGWHNTDVAVHFNGSDGLSGIASISPNVTMTNEGVDQGTTGTATDKAGNSASAEINGIKIDKTTPTTIILFSGDNNCSSGAVKISFTATDNLSGIAKTVYNLDGKGWVIYANEFNVSSAGNHSLTFKSYDNAGNIENVQTRSFTIENSLLEAAIKFDPDKKDLKVHNIKDGSEANYTILPSKKENDDEKGNKQKNSDDEKGWILRKYQVKNCSNNLLSVILKYKNEGKELKAEIVSLQYDDKPVINARENKIAVQYSLDKSSNPKELVQNISAKNRFDIGAKYDAKKGQTAISVKLAGIKEKKEIKSGMVILEMVISNGTLKYQY
ncbi:MAG: NosD domain-containing protein [bacterium]|nr:NosD domain-containing protein [bacterium]